MNVLSGLVCATTTLSLLSLSNLQGVTLIACKKTLISGNKIKIGIVCLVEVYQVSLRAE